MLDRRAFVAGAAAGALTVSFGLPSGAKAVKPGSMDASFRDPPPDSRPHTWWHWMNGNVTADGITRDLEAMARVGVGGVQMFDVGVGIPQGPAAVLSPLWVKLVRHAVSECDRLGISFTLHNCPGWSSSGGPWITPELGMQQLVWSEAAVEGGTAVDVQLPQPLVRLGHYRDALAVAIPAGATDAAQGQIVRASTGGKTVESRLITDGDAATGVDLTAGADGALTFAFEAPVTARSVTVQAVPGDDIPNFEPRTFAVLEVSDDGRNFRKLADLAVPFWRLRTIPPLGASFGEVRARYFRLTLPAALRVTEIRLSATARTADIGAKAGWGRVANRGEEPGVAAAGDAIDPGRVIDLSGFIDAGGRLRWTPPPGDWTVLRFGHTATGAKNVAASDTGIGLECDKFSRTALDFHFEKYFGQVRDVMRKLGKRGLAGALVDSYETGQQNWTAGFPAEFEKRRGYPITRYMPALTGRIVGSPEITERFLWDFRRVLALLMEEHYFDRFHELCQRDGLVSYTEPYGNGPFDDMQAGAKMDRLMGEFWVRGGAAAYSVKLAAAVAHVHGKNFIGAESFTGRPAQSRWLEHPYAMKALGDEMYALGLNHFIFHRYAQQPHPDAKPGMTMGPWGFHFDRTNTWFEAAGPWLTYAARCQHMLKCGNFVADILFFTGESSPVQVAVHVEEPVAATLSGARPRLPLDVPQGHDYDVCDAEVLLKRARIVDGRIVLPDGISYRVLVLPEDQRITRALMERLRAMVAQGMWLVGAPPRQSHGLAGYPESDAAVQAMAQELWGDLDGETRRERDFGEGRVIRGRSLREVLDAAGAQPDFEISDAAPGAAIRWIHRRDGDADIYFVANGRRRSEEFTCTFRVAGKRPEIWNAETGETVAAPDYEPGEGWARMPLRLDPAGSCFVVFRAPARAGLPAIGRHGERPSTPRVAASPVTGSFTLTGWIKPETDLWPISPEIASADRSPAVAAARAAAFARGGSAERLGISGASFLLDPPPGDALFGAGHAMAALSAGRNGLILYENRGDAYPAVLALPVAIAGWTHLALVYDRGTPTLFLNGRPIGSGTRSDATVHAALDHSVARPRFFEGDSAALRLESRALPAGEIARLAALPLPAPPAPPAFTLASGPEAGLLLWENGRYVVGDRTIDASGIAPPAALAKPWQVSFPEGLGAPARVTLDRLQSLHRHADAGVRHFSGTASYATSFTVPRGALGEGRRLWLDLGRVEVIAGVRVNGRQLATLWKPPFLIDVTDAVQAGANRLDVAVTNLWPNRLIGDEQLPQENAYSVTAFSATGGIDRLPDWYRAGNPKPPGGRVTFSTWKHYDRDSPLLESGLLGPVLLRSALKMPLPQ
ncbi:glycosyl hydrolase [Sphingomonas sp.]|uniref:glycosyl hydrolase n=1 Tax=Sphingomonas sp. TaxID=28214 RepID=UPI002ED79E29